MVYNFLVGLIGFFTAVTIAEIVLSEPQPQQFGQSFPAISPWTYFGGSDGQIRTISSSTQVVVGDDATTTDSALETSSLTITGLTSANCLGTDGNGVVGVGTCTGGGSTEDASTTLAINGVEQGVAEILDLDGTDFAITESPTGDFDVSIAASIARDSELYSDSDIDGSEAAFSGWDKNASDDFDGAFSSLTSIPTGLSDGDDDTQLSEAEVEAFIDGTESAFTGWDKNAADDFDGVFSSLTSIPAGLSDGDDDTQLSEEQVEDFIGAGFSGNTETLITATYQDGDGTFDFVVNDDLSQYDNTTSGFITSADDSVSGSELDGVFSTTGYLQRTGANTYTTATCVDITGSADLCDGSDDGSAGGASALTDLDDVTLTSTSTGDILYNNGSGQFVNLGIGTADQVLSVAGGVPVWSDAVAGGGGSGAGWATTTDDEEVTYTSPVNPVYVGGSASNTATHILDYRDSSLKLASTTNSNATATIESTNDAQALRFGDQGGEGIEAYFGTSNTVTWRSFTGITSWVLDSAITLTANLAADTVDAIGEIASALRSGTDSTLVTGTAGTNGNLIEWNTDGDAVDSGVASADVLTGNETITLSGDVTGSGATSITTALSTNSVSDNEIDYGSVTLNDLTFDVGSVSKTEYGYLNGVTSAIQTQLNSKEGELTDKASLQSTISDVSDFAEADGDTYSGTHDFGGASFLEIPNGTNPTANDPGELAHDTTDNQLILDDRVIRTEERIFGFTLASTSPEFVSGGVLPVPPEVDGFTLTQFSCRVESGTSVVVNVSDGTNDTETITCDTNGETDTNVSTNDTFTAGETVTIEIGTVTGAVDYLTFSAFGTWTRE